MRLATLLRTLPEMPAVRAFTDNPVVVRDLRAQMRGTKSYWYQGLYLLLLSLLAVAGYAGATGQGLDALRGATDSGTVSIIEAQGRLESFYYFIFMTLAALICVIAPALTASSVVGERQRQSLDLLVTTPLTAGELLIGKLLSSIAFLGLLLALSLPASALCVLLGGATIADVLRIYALLAVDGIVLAGVGLFFSCAVRVPLLAVIWTYGTVAAGVGLTFALGTGAVDGSMQHAHLPTPVLSIAALNPFLAVLPWSQQSVAVGPVTFPVWVGTAVAGALLLRFLLTAATYRFGVYGGSAAPSMRRQALALSTLLALICVQAFTVVGNPWRDLNSDNLLAGTALLFSLSFFAAAPFLANLFVPASPDDAPPGATQDSTPTDGAWYRPRRIFRPEHGGALPAFHLWIVLTMVAVAGGTAMGGRADVLSHPFMWGGLLLGALYLSGLGFLFWGASRLAARVAKGLAGARALALGGVALVAAAPMLILMLRHDSMWQDHALSWLWVFRPILVADETARFFPAIIVSTILCYTLGGTFSALAQRVRRTTGAPTAKMSEA